MHVGTSLGQRLGLGSGLFWACFQHTLAGHWGLWDSTENMPVNVLRTPERLQSNLPPLPTDCNALRHCEGTENTYPIRSWRHGFHSSLPSSMSPLQKARFCSFWSSKTSPLPRSKLNSHIKKMPRSESLFKFSHRWYWQPSIFASN